MAITKLIKICLLFCFSLLFITACSAEPAIPLNKDAEDPVKTKLALEMIEQMNAEQFNEATKRFNAKMLAALPSDKLATAWKQINSQAGEFQTVLNTSQKNKGNDVTVFAATQFEHVILDIKIAFDQDNNIIGLFFSPSQYKPALKQSTDANNDTEYLTTREIEFGDKDWLLTGEVTLPTKGDNSPLVILVHGSGPNDMDQSIGPNKPFQDIAHGLAKLGISTLRFNKRTYQHASKYAESTSLQSQLTVNEESIDDAVHAFNFSKTIKKIDTNRIFIAGISQGGMLMPRIAKQTPTAAGYIMLAAPARGLEVLIQEQYNYIFNLDGELSPEELQASEDLESQVKALSQLDVNSQFTTKQLPLGLSQTYWLDLKNYNMVEEAKAISKPLLIVQGGRDYQVLADKDFKIWQNTFKQAKNVDLKLFPKLNHLMMSGDKASTPEEYYQKKSVDDNFITYITEWIKGN